MADAEGTNGTGNGPLLFSGFKFWFSRQIPQRAYLIEQARTNGASVVIQEKDADILLVDHLKKQAAPGTHSYQFVEHSLRQGEILDLATYSVGPPVRADRPVGSARVPVWTTRRAFTEEEDQFLYNFVQPFKERGGAWKGNEIYKQIERIRPSHTYQSWRDRFIKKICFQQRQITEDINLGDTEVEQEDAVERPTKRRRVQFEAEVGEDQDEISDPVQNTQKPNNIDNFPLTDEGEHYPPIPTRTPLEELSSLQNIQREATPPSHENQKPRQSSFQNRDNQNDGSEFIPATSVISHSSQKDKFEKHEIQMLFKALPHILNTPTEDLDQSWEAFAREYDSHTVEQWRKLFDLTIVPEYKRRHNLKSENKLRAYISKIVAEDSQEDTEEEEKGSAEVNAEPGPELNGKLSNVDKQRQRELEKVQREEELSRAQREEEIDYSTSAESDSQHSPQQVQCVECQCWSADDAIENWHWHEGRAYCPNCAWVDRVADFNNQPQSEQSMSHDRLTEPVVDVTETGDHLIDDNPVKHREQNSASLSETKSPLSLRYSDPRPNEGRKRASQSTTTNSTSQNSQAQRAQATGAEDSDKNSNLQEIPDTIVRFGEQFVSQEPPESGQRPYKSQSTSQTGSSRSRYETAQPEQVIQPRNPMFFSEESEESDREENQLKSSMIELFDETDETPRPTSSHGALSDTGSEYYAFEEIPERSQLWQTSPDRTQEREADTDEEGEFDHASPESQSLPSRQPLTPLSQKRTKEKTNSDTAKMESTVQHFETARQEQLFDTQAILQQPMEGLDDLSEYALPPPEGGWEELGLDEVIEDHDATPSRPYTVDSYDSQAAFMSGALQVSRSSSPAATSTPEQRSFNQENHAASGGPAQNLSGREKEHGSSAEDDSQQARLDDQWFDEQEVRFSNRQVDGDFAYHLITAAYLATSMNTKLATTILQRMFDNYENVKKYSHRMRQKYSDIGELEAKSFLPENVRGCWTNEDDIRLMSRNGNEIAKVEAKHGEVNAKTRVNFLEEMHGSE